METVKIKIIAKNIIIQWLCPRCNRTNTERQYEGTVLRCYMCGKNFKGEIEKEEHE